MQFPRVGVVAGPVPADHRGAGMRVQPSISGGLPVRQHVDHVTGAHVHQHRPVHLALRQREVIDPEHLLRRGRDLRRSAAAAISRSTVAGCTAMPSVPASLAAARPASSSPNPASMPSSGTLRRRYRSLSPTACSAKVWGAAHPGSRSGTGAPARRSALPADHPPRRPPSPANTRHALALTPARTAGSMPRRSGTTPRSPPHARCLPRDARAVPPGAGTTRSAGFRPAQKRPRQGAGRWPPPLAA